MCPIFGMRILKKIKPQVLFASPQGNSMPYFQMSPIDPSICWDDLSWFQSLTRLPIILKGILTKEDAELAVKHNVHGIIVSNHGGRQLDEVPASVSRKTSEWVCLGGLCGGMCPQQGTLCNLMYTPSP